MLKSKRFLLASAGVLSAIVSAPNVAWAQAAPGASEEGAQEGASLEDIIVTARRRDENLQDVPISISSLPAETLEENNVRTPADLSVLVPSLQIAPVANNATDARISLRGQSPIGSLSIFNDHPISLYLDGVYYARVQGVLSNLVDIRAVEVAKGPQGTLIGRNSTGGAVLIETNTPQHEFSGSLRASFASFGQRDYSGVINIPLGNDFAIRAVASLQSSEGYLRNVLPQDATGGGRTYSLTPLPGYTTRYTLDDGDQFDTSSNLYRVSLGYNPAGDFEAILSYTYREEEASGFKTHVIGFRNTPTATWNAQPTVAAPFNDIEGRTFPVGTLQAFINRQIAGDYRDVESQGLMPSEGEFQTLSLRMNHTLGGIDWRWLTAFQAFDRFAADRTTFGPIARQVTFFPMDGYEAFQQELTGSSDFDVFGHNMSLTAGLFYFQESIDTDGVITFATTATGPNVTNPSAQLYRGENISYAAYSQLNYDLTDRLRITVGGRYSVDERSITQSNRNATGCILRVSDTSTAVLNPCLRTTEVDFDKFTYTLSADYNITDDIMLYATTRSGYKSGGLNGFGTTPGSLPFDPEVVVDYEVGLKAEGSIGSMPFRINLALYQTQLEGQHQQLVVANVAASPACIPGTPTYPNLCGAPNAIVVLNAAESEVQGAELDIEFLPSDSLRLTFAASYTHGEFVDYTLNAPAGYALSPGTASSLNGRPFAGPLITAVASAQYTLPITSLFGLPVDSVEVRADVSYRGEPEYTSQNTDPFVLRYSTDQTITNFRLGVNDIADSRVSLGVFVRNAFDEHYYNNVGGPAVGTSGIFTGDPAAPRIVGVELIARFGDN